MQDPFKRHGIDHLSPSSLRLWRDCPAVWVGRYLLRVSDEAGPAAWRGQAVEAAMDRLLYGHSPQTAMAAMLSQWDHLAQGLADEDALKEYNALEDFLVNAGVAFQGLPIPLQRQAKMELYLPGISVPLTGYADWIWPDHGSDLKTTWRIPTSPDPSHVEQVAAYSMYHGIGFDLTYVSPKRWTRYEVTPAMATEGYDRLLE